jgi:hypothetical protein
MSERPKYESKSDIEFETQVASHLAAVWTADAVKLPRFYKCDWALRRGKKVAALLEIKCRKNAADKYPTIILSSDKWSYLRQMDAALNVPALFVAKFTDGIRYIRPATSHNFTVEMGGRFDRGDWQDMEPVIHIPISEMIKIESK